MIFVLVVLYLFIYFILFLTVSSLSCGMQDLPLWHTCPLLRWAGFSLVVVHRLQSMQAPEHVGSVVVAHGPSSCGLHAQ